MWSQTLLYGAHPENPNFLTEQHALRGLPGAAYVRDKIEAEREVRRFATENPDTVVTVLRVAPILGPTVQNYLTRWLSRRLVPTLLGCDPLLQVIHEMDAVAAFKRAIDVDVSGTFNIVGAGVLPVSTLVRLAGRVAWPWPYTFMRQTVGILWAANLCEAPPAFLRYLRYLCVADGARAEVELGFVAAHTAREAVLDFGGALRLRDARLLREAHV